jgi:hypothetical protein
VIAFSHNIPVSAAPLARLALRERLTAFGNRLERYLPCVSALSLPITAQHLEITERCCRHCGN